jgi:hypothetical protein
LEDLEIELAAAYNGKWPRDSGAHDAAPGDERDSHIVGEPVSSALTQTMAPPSAVAAAEISLP